jgi:hypothetical protein
MISCPPKSQTLRPHVLLIVEPERPFRDADALRLLLTQFEFIMHEPVDERGFAHRAAPQQNEFGFIQWTPPAAPHTKVVVENLGGIRCAFVMLLPTGAKHFGRQIERIIAVKIQSFERVEIPQ